VLLHQLSIPHLKSRSKKMKKTWNTPQLTAYGSVEQITEQVTVNKTPGSGDSITITVNQVPVATITGPGSLESVTVE
jgi:hypothetical protein